MREKWIKEGDANTPFFHKLANMRRHVNTLCSLSTDEGRVEELDLHDHTYKHFMELFRTQNSSRLRMVGEDWK